MKKLLGLIFFVCGIAGAVSQPQSLGNVKLKVTQLANTSQVTVSTFTSISPTGTYMQIASTGGPVYLSPQSSYPAISTSTAFNGQWLILISTATTNVVQIGSGTASGVASNNKWAVISSSMAPVQYIFNSALAQWLQIGSQ